MPCENFDMMKTQTLTWIPHRSRIFPRPPHVVLLVSPGVAGLRGWSPSPVDSVGWRDRWDRRHLRKPLDHPLRIQLISVRTGFWDAQKQPDQKRLDFKKANEPGHKYQSSVICPTCIIKRGTQNTNSKEHCMCIKEKRNISSQSIFRNLSHFYTPFQYLCLQRDFWLSVQPPI